MATSAVFSFDGVNTIVANVYDAVMMKYQQTPMMEYKAKVLGLADSPGVKMRGRVGQKELYKEMAKARVWGYPTNFLETSCIGAMEARASGLAIVTSALGALKETVGEHGRLIPWGKDEAKAVNQTDEYREEFIRESVRLLSDQAAWERGHEAALEDVDKLDWRHRIAEWDAVIEKRMG